MDEFDFCNKHYITVDDRNRIIDAWSDGPHSEKSTNGAICINKRGSYQLRLIVGGVETEENPMMCTMESIPLYKWSGSEVVRRTAEEIAADIAAIPPAPPIPMEQLRADMDYVMLMTDLM